MITSMFTEILGKDDWYRWMDLLFTHFDQCAVILLAPVAVLKGARTALLATKREADINAYLTRPQSFNMKALCKSLSRLLHTTPAKHLTAIGAPTADNSDEPNGRVVALDSVQEARASVAASVGIPIVQIPKGESNAEFGEAMIQSPTKSSPPKTSTSLVSSTHPPLFAIR